MPASNGQPSGEVVEGLLRGLRLLECFTQTRPELTLADLVRASGRPKTSTHRLLNTLEHADWVERTPTGRYRLTLKAFQLGSIGVQSLDVRREATPIMATLAADSGDSVYLVVPDGYRAVCLERVDSDSSVRIADLNVGGSQPLHLGAGPRALLAFREHELLPLLEQAGLEQRTPSSVTDLATLTEDLAAIRRRGYAVSRGDATTGVGALGAPVYDVHGRVVAALSVGGLIERVAPEREPWLAEHLLEATAALSARLGHRPSPHKV